MSDAAPEPATAFRRYASKTDLAAAAASDIALSLGEAIQARGEARLALAGGRTPEPVYRQLGEAALPWSQVTATLTDERFVPPDSALSNAGLLARTLFAGPAAAARFIPLWSDAPSPEAAADEADRRLAALAAPFDLVVLGVGDDGHTASLFPHTPALTAGLDLASHRRVIAAPCHAPAPKEPRLSLTLSALLNARTIVILATGENKRAVLEAACAGDDIYAMPIRAILRQTRTPVTIYWSPED